MAIRNFTWRAIPVEDFSRGGFLMLEKPFHDPVMTNEIFEIMNLKPGMVYVDGTIGLGGHSLLASKLVSPGGTIIGLDWDASMLEIARDRLSGETSVSINLHNIDFRFLTSVMETEQRLADGILLDLGLNSGQVDDPERGFSFQEPGPLDMKMDKRQGETAASMLNRMSPYEIETILFEFGDERWARAIAKVIVDRRRTMPLRTTQDLVDCVLAAVPAKAREVRIHPATRTFQAVRIAVNRELSGLSEAILNAAELLNQGGTLVILSYHSGEDKIVKNAFRSLDSERFEILTKKPLVPSATEVDKNRRARSARLRAVRRSSTPLTGSKKGSNKYSNSL